MSFESDDDFELRPSEIRARLANQLNSKSKSPEKRVEPPKSSKLTSPPTKKRKLSPEIQFLQENSENVIQNIQKSLEKSSLDSNCPICGVELGLVPENDRNVHVNSCLDQGMLPEDPWGDLIFCICGQEMTSWSNAGRQSHFERCLDGFMESENQSTSIFTKIATCPCCKSIWPSQTLSGRIAHVKSCAKSRLISTRRLIQILKKHAMNAPPETSVVTNSKPVKPKVTKPVKQLTMKHLTKGDSDLELALALSKSMAPEQERLKKKNVRSIVLPPEEAEAEVAMEVDSHLSTIQPTTPRQSSKDYNDSWSRAAACPCQLHPHLVRTNLINPGYHLVPQELTYGNMVEHYDHLMEIKRQLYKNSIEALEQELNRELSLLRKERQAFLDKFDEENAETLEILQNLNSQ